MQRPEVQAKLQRPRLTAQRQRLLDALREAVASTEGRDQLREMLATVGVMLQEDHVFAYVKTVRNGEEQPFLPVDEFDTPPPMRWTAYERRRPTDATLIRSDGLTPTARLEDLKTLAHQIQWKPGVSVVAVPRTGTFDPSTVDDPKRTYEVIAEGRERRRRARKVKIGKKR